MLTVLLGLNQPTCCNHNGVVAGLLKATARVVSPGVIPTAVQT